MNDKANNQVVVRAGAGFCELLTIAFIVLRLIGVITWSWWWVFAPIWIPVALAVVGLVIGLIIIVLAGIGD